MYYIYLYLNTVQLYPILPHSHIGIQLMGQEPCGPLFVPARQRRKVLTTIPSIYYAPASAG